MAKPTEWERGLNDGLALAAELCFNNGFEGAGREILNAGISVKDLDGEHYRDLTRALKGAGEEAVLAKVRAERAAGKETP